MNRRGLTTDYADDTDQNRYSPARMGTPKSEFLEQRKDSSRET